MRSDAPDYAPTSGWTMIWGPIKYNKKARRFIYGPMPTRPPTMFEKFLGTAAPPAMLRFLN